MKIRIAVVVLGLALSGCASIPLGTMLRFASYDWQDVLATRPERVGAALQLPADVVLDPDSPLLHVELSENASSDSAFNGTAKLVLQETGQRVITPLPPADDGQRWYVFALNAKGIEQFRMFQDRLNRLSLAGGEPSVALSVKWRFKEVGERISVPVSIWLKLDEADSWFAVAEDAELELDKRVEYAH